MKTALTASAEENHKSLKYTVADAEQRGKVVGVVRDLYFGCSPTLRDDVGKAVRDHLAER